MCERGGEWKLLKVLPLWNMHWLHEIVSEWNPKLLYWNVSYDVTQNKQTSSLWSHLGEKEVTNVKEGARIIVININLILFVSCSLIFCAVTSHASYLALQTACNAVIGLLPPSIKRHQAWRRTVELKIQKIQASKFTMRYMIFKVYVIFALWDVSNVIRMKILAWSMQHALHGSSSGCLTNTLYTSITRFGATRWLESVSFGRWNKVTSLVLTYQRRAERNCSDA